MRILSLLIFFIATVFSNQQTNSPHGAGFKISCKTCHSSKGWQLDKEIYSFNHNSTNLPLVGQHTEIDCRQCHKTLIFSEAKTECNQCHNDIHQATVGQDCSRCHTPTSWLVSNINAIHQVSRFPLFGAHRTADCSQCHKSESLSRFDVPGVNCIDCHRENYMAASNPNHFQSGFPEDCSFCHPLSSLQWTGTAFNHNIFPLQQAHSTVKCADCHSTGNYTDAKSDCYSCHQQDFLTTKKPDHNASKLSTICQDCHTLSPGWKPTNFDHSSFPLTLGHSVPECIDCHTGGNYTSTPEDCFSCHQKNYLATTNPNHNASGIPKTCETCHTVDPGWKPSNFDHSRFPLNQGHSTPTCIDCHTSGNFTSTAKDCYSCHQKDFLATTNPNHSTSGISKTCETCHSLTPGWKPVSFNHTGFPLTLGHSVPTCIECHTGGNYTSTPKDCYSCHQQNYASTTNPVHSSAGFSKICQTCHTVNPGWKPTSFIHGSFPLTLGHASPTCSACHTGGNYTSISTDCYSCHQKNYLATTNPNHSAAGFPTLCQTCHTSNPGWKPTTFSHNSFPLTQGHSTPSCIACHKGGNYTTTPTDCYSCHQQSYLSSTNPNHTAAGFSKTCQTCHSINPGWKPTTFNHSSFPLTSGHSTSTCIDCHKGENYTTTPIDCYSCHQQNYTATSNPNHVTASFPTTCGNCHSTNPGWKPATFNHSVLPLTLGHAIPACIDCHKGGNFTTVPTDCYYCHQLKYTATSNPSHIAAGFPTTCATCHNTNPGWKPATFNHTVFPLTLGHATPTCIDCHKGGNYTTTPTDCYSCHQIKYTATTNPSHIAAGFPTTCATCHNTNPGWKPATFNHTTFPLTLGHATPVCIDCHKGGNYTTTPTDCYACHQLRYTATTNPAHVAAGFPTTCLLCHTTNPGWKPATYNHTTFPLTLGHSTAACADCHKGGNYTTTPTDCFTCHKLSYDNSTNPSHKTLGFSTLCLQCHTTRAGWKPASYPQHDTQFPIYSGRHKGEWTVCTDCHTNPANYTLFNCIRCHADEHKGKNYTNAQCYSCHPRGTGD